MLPLAMALTETASSDPAMALGLPRVTGVCFNPVLTIGSCRCQVMADYSVRFRSNSTADTEPFDQCFVARLIDTGEVVEQLAPLRYQFEQSTPRVVILDMSLEMLGEAADALRKDRDLHLRRACIAGLGRKAFDDF